MIDLRVARADPEGFRRAVARKGAAEAFDELLEADARWRELVPQVDELRSRQKLKGKPTPEQVEELKRVKEDLRRLEDELAPAGVGIEQRVERLGGALASNRLAEPVGLRPRGPKVDQPFVR